MKKKFLLTTLTMIFCFCIIGVFTACNEKHMHIYVENVTTPTCTAQGFTTHTCECGDYYIDTYVNAFGHEFTNYVSNNDATCLTDGTEIANCNHAGCQEKDTRTDENSALGHEFTNYVSNNDATCLADGTETASCNHAGCQEKDTRTDENSALGHEFTNYVSNNDATCLADGTETASCNHAGCQEKDTRTDENSALAHSEVVDNPISNICQEGKTQGSHCVNCGTILIAQQIIPANHNVAEGCCKDCNVEFLATYINVDGATHNNPEVYYSNGYDRYLLPAQKTGYIFDGWYTDEKFTNEITFIAGNTSGKINIYAKWNVIVYTATFIANDNIVDVVEFTIETENLDEPAIPVIEGFDGAWEDYILELKHITIFATYKNATGFMPIFTVEQLKRISSTGNYVLMNDLSLKNISWEPIENYNGVFDGSGHTISDLRITTGFGTIGFFVSNSGTIKNLGLTNVYIDIYNSAKMISVGALVGNNTGEIINCYVTGSVFAETYNNTSGCCASGLVSYMSNGIIENSYFIGEVSATTTNNTPTYSSGLVGKMSNSELKNCYTDGTVTASAYSGRAYSSGLVCSSTNSIIKYCYTKSDVYALSETTVSSMFAGGLVAYSYDDNISYSYAYGSIDAKSTYCSWGKEYHSGIIGGFVGEIKAGNISACYAVCDVLVNSYDFYLNVGGFAGYNNSGNIINCYSLGDVVAESGGKSSAGGFVGCNNGEINSAYSYGNVKSQHLAGGFVALNQKNIADSFAIGKVSSTEQNSFAGGFVGSNEGEVNNCFYSLEEQISSGGEISIVGIKVEISVIKSYIFLKETLDFDESFWLLCNGELPVLKAIVKN